MGVHTASIYKEGNLATSIKVTNAYTLGHNFAYLEIFVQIYAHTYKIRYIQDFTLQYFFPLMNHHRLLVFCFLTFIEI